MPESSTGGEAIKGGSAEDLKNLSASASQSSDESQGAPSAESPTAETQDDNKPKDIADAVRAALTEGKEQPSGSGEGEEDETPDPAKPADGAKPKEGEEEDLGELTEDELKSYKPKTRRRFEKLDRENKDLQAQLANVTPEVEGFRKIQEFSKKANLNREDVNTGFEIMRLMKNDPVRAHAVLTPIFRQLEAMVGVVLPPDLQAQVTEGKITPQTAQELSRLRATQHTSTAIQRDNQERTQREQQEQSVQNAQKLQVDVAKAITNWDSSWKASDPDYSLKKSRVDEAIELELTRAVVLAKEGKPNKLPKTVEEAVALANDVKKRVEKEMRQFIPKRTNTITHVSGNGVNNGSKPQPKSVHDAVSMAIGRK